MDFKFQVQNYGPYNYGPYNSGPYNYGPYNYNNCSSIKYDFESDSADNSQGSKRTRKKLYEELLKYVPNHVPDIKIDSFEKRTRPEY
jgi:hypothetical protein